MADATVNADGPAGGKASPARGPSGRTALIVAIVGGVIAAGATVLVLRNQYGTGMEALLAAAALAGFGMAAYGLMQAVLAIVDTAGERRRQEREVSERRKGERARRPPS
ncbi:MAG: hypothetical protein ABI681_04625 [Gemmatimonadales bacterium]